MIITPAGDVVASDPDRSPAVGHSGMWRSLARRGMLHTEVQVFDVMAVSAETAGTALEPGCVELLYCLSGLVEVRFDIALRRSLHAGEIVAIHLKGHDPEAKVYGCPSGVLLRLRVLPLSVSAQMRTRRPACTDGPSRLALSPAN